jgi:hypothetical protein
MNVSEEYAVSILRIEVVIVRMRPMHADRIRLFVVARILGGRGK